MGNGREKRLVDSAKRSFATRGYYGTSISQMAQQSGIARATFYQYFDNKLHIFRSILDSFVDNLRDCIKPVSLSPGAPNPLLQIQANLTRVFELVLEEADLTRILLTHASTPDPAVQTHLSDFYSEVADMIEGSLNLGVAMDLVRPCNTRLTAYAVIGAVKEVVLQLTSSDKPQPSVEELARELLEFGMGGILVKSQAQILQSTRMPGA